MVEWTYFDQVLLFILHLAESSIQSHLLMRKTKKQFILRKQRTREVLVISFFSTVVLSAISYLEGKFIQ